MKLTDVSASLTPMMKTIIARGLDADLRPKSTRTGLTFTLTIKRTRHAHEPAARGRARAHSLVITAPHNGPVHIVSHMTTFNEKNRTTNDHDEEHDFDNISELCTFLDSWATQVISTEEAAIASHEHTVTTINDQKSSISTTSPSPRTTSSSSEPIEHDGVEPTQNVRKSSKKPYTDKSSLAAWLAIDNDDPRMTWDLWQRIRHRALPPLSEHTGPGRIITPCLTLTIRNDNGSMHRPNACRGPMDRLMRERMLDESDETSTR